MTFVSIIVPCYNEERTIYGLLEAIYRQTYPRSLMEVVLADGMSEDRTRDVVKKFVQEHPELSVKLVDNPRRIIPSGLNRAIEASGGEVLVRLDAHSAPSPDYVERCVSALREGKGENVGGVWEIRPGGSGWIARSIAVAASHPLGVGDAAYRYTNRSAYVDTVPFGAFRRETLERIGWFDETLLTNEDYELNARLRQTGGKIWLDPAIRSVYYARSSLRALAAQYWRYGFWKWRMLRRYPGTLRWRQALPPVFVAGVIGLGVGALWWAWARWMLLLVGCLYLLVLALASLPLALKKKDLPLVIGVPLAIATMHITWGGGLLFSMFKGMKR